MKTEEKVLIGLALVFLVWPWKESADVILDFDPTNRQPVPYPTTVYPNDYSGTYGPGIVPGIDEQEWWLRG